MSIPTHCPPCPGRRRDWRPWDSCPLRSMCPGLSPRSSADRRWGPAYHPGIESIHLIVALRLPPTCQRIFGNLQASSTRLLPLRLRGQPAAGPCGVVPGLEPGDARDRLLRELGIPVADVAVVRRLTAFGFHAAPILGVGHFGALDPVASRVTGCCGVSLKGFELCVIFGPAPMTERPAGTYT